MIDLKKLGKEYKNIAITKGTYTIGIPKLDFNKIPKSLEINEKSEGLVLYIDDEIKVGKIKRIVKNVKIPYIEIYEEDKPEYRPIICNFTQVLLLDKNSKLYKRKLKKF